MAIYKNYNMTSAYKILFSYQKLVKIKCLSCLKVKTIKNTFLSPLKTSKNDVYPLQPCSHRKL